MSQKELDENALLETLMDKYVCLLRKLAYGYHKYSNDTIDDMVGDVILHICEKIRKKTYKSTGSFKCWVCMVASNFWISKYCRGKKRICLKEDAEMEFIDCRTNYTDALSPMDREQKLLALEKLMNELPKPLFEIVSLRINNQFTYKEISEALSKPLSTVAVKLNFSYGLLKEKMEELGYRDSSL